MAVRSRPQPKKIRHNRRPAINVDKLALMLQIDLQLGRQDEFRRRLQQALEDARNT